MFNYLVTCPHCNNTVTVKTASITRTGFGGTSASCPKCHKTVKIEFRNGSVWGVSK